MWTYCQVGPLEQIWVKFESKYNTFHFQENAFQNEVCKNGLNVVYAKRSFNVTLCLLKNVLWARNILATNWTRAPWPLGICRQNPFLSYISSPSPAPQPITFHVSALYLIHILVLLQLGILLVTGWLSHFCSVYGSLNSLNVWETSGGHGAASFCNVLCWW